MIIPTKSDNIYPRTLENVRYILLHYFPTRTHTEIEEEAAWIYENRGLELNQIEFAAKNVSEHYQYISELLDNKGLSFHNLMNYGTQALYDFPKENMSTSRKDKIAKLREHLLS